MYTPTTVFNGTLEIVGAASAAAAGAQFTNIVLNRSFDPAPIRIDVDSFTPATGAVSATVTMYSETFALSGDAFHFILIEDDVSGENTHITRALASHTITLAGAGSTAPFSTTFTINPAWNPAKLRVVAIVQRPDHEIVQAGSSHAHPDFKVRAMVPFARTLIGPSTAAYETAPLTVMNVGLTDTFTMSVVVDEAPPGWSVAFKDSVGATHTDPFEFGLAGEASTTFTAVVTPGSAGYVKYHLVVTSPNLTRPVEIPFVYITDDIDALLVDDDGGASYENYFKTAMDSAAVPYGVWDRGAAPLSAEVAQSFDLLVWNVGLGYPTLDADDKTFLSQYLDAGGSLFLSGQDVGWELNDPSGDPDVPFYRDYLHATYVRDDTNILYLDGVTGDPVSDGLSLHIAGGDGANNQTYPDQIAAADADATEILFYQGDGCGAIRSEDSLSGAKVVYLGFGFEGIDNAQDRHDLLIPAIEWLQGVIFRDGFESGNTSSWSTVSP